MVQNCSEKLSYVVKRFVTQIKIPRYIFFRNYLWFNKYKIYYFVINKWCCFDLHELWLMHDFNQFCKCIITSWVDNIAMPLTNLAPHDSSQVKLKWRLGYNEFTLAKRADNSCLILSQRSGITSSKKTEIFLKFINNFVSIKISKVKS